MSRDHTLPGPGKISEVGLEPFLQFGIGHRPHITLDLILHQVRLAGHDVTLGAMDLLRFDRFIIHNKPITFYAGLITLRSLGYGDMRYGDFKDLMEEHNLPKCPHEVGPFGRVAFNFQPGWSNIHVHMEPIENVAGEPMVFTWSSYFSEEKGDYNNVDSKLDAVSMEDDRIIPDTYQWIVELPEDWSLPQAV